MDLPAVLIADPLAADLRGLEVESTAKIAAQALAKETLRTGLTWNVEKGSRNTPNPSLRPVEARMAHPHLVAVVQAGGVTAGQSTDHLHRASTTKRSGEMEITSATAKKVTADAEILILQLERKETR